MIQVEGGMIGILTNISTMLATIGATDVVVATNTAAITGLTATAAAL